MIIRIYDFTDVSQSKTFIDIQPDYSGDVVTFSPYAIKKLLALAQRKDIIPRNGSIHSRRPQEKGKVK